MLLSLFLLIGNPELAAVEWSERKSKICFQKFSALTNLNLVQTTFLFALSAVAEFPELFQQKFDTKDGILYYSF